MEIVGNLNMWVIWLDVVMQMQMVVVRKCENVKIIKYKMKRIVKQWSISMGS